MHSIRILPRQRAGLLLAALVVSCICGAGQSADAQAVRRAARRVQAQIPPRSTPEAQGMDSETLAAGLDYLLDNRDTYRIHSVTVIRHGRVVLDTRFYPFSREWRHDIASVTKSYISTLVGIAIDQGFLEGVHLPVLDFFPDFTVANRDDRKERMTVEDLLTMRSGFECDASNSEWTLTQMQASPDWIQYTLDLPMADEPGDRWVYCSPNIHLLSAILERSTGMSTLEFATTYLFNPLGITDFEWLVDPHGLERGWGDLHLLPSDMPKLGLLYANDGKWRGRQILSSWWVDLATTGAAFQVPGWPPGNGYSYLWYYAPDNIYAAGRGGQRIHIYPEEGLVVGLNVGSGFGNLGLVPTEFLEDYVLDAIESDGALAPNPASVALLESKVAAAEASTEGPPQPVGDLPSIAQIISGRTYALSDNLYGIDNLKVTFPGGDVAILELELPEVSGGPVLVLEVGLDDVNRFSQGRFGTMTASKGEWFSESLFSTTVDELSLINLWRWDLTFEGNTVQMELISLAGGELPATATGTMVD